MYYEIKTIIINYYGVYYIITIMNINNGYLYYFY